MQPKQKDVEKTSISFFSMRHLLRKWFQLEPCWMQANYWLGFYKTCEKVSGSSEVNNKIFLKRNLQPAQAWIGLKENSYLFTYLRKMALVKLHHWGTWKLGIWSSKQRINLPHQLTVKIPGSIIRCTFHNV